jgi:hypothetical protein
VFPSLGASSTRAKITWLIVAFDLAICVCFIFNMQWISFFI